MPLPQGFGAEIVRFDAQTGGTPTQIDALRKAFDTHHLLVFRECGVLPGERQAMLAGWFGPVGANRDADGKLWTYLDNREKVGSNELKFHSDISFMPTPFLGLSLHPTALPSRPTITSFISTALAWEALDADLRDLLAERRVLHEFLDESSVAEAFTHLRSWHPARMAHPRTGRPLLFVSENNVREIEGLSREASAPLLARIFATLYAPERRYDHVWQPGDFLVWDNRSLQHARPEVADPADGPRIMQRVALGTASFGEQFEALKAAAA